MLPKNTLVNYIKNIDKWALKHDFEYMMCEINGKPHKLYDYYSRQTVFNMIKSGACFYYLATSDKVNLCVGHREDGHYYFQIITDSGKSKTIEKRLEKDSELNRYSYEFRKNVVEVLGKNTTKDFPVYIGFQCAYLEWISKLFSYLEDVEGVSIEGSFNKPYDFFENNNFESFEEEDFISIIVEEKEFLLFEKVMDGGVPTYRIFATCYNNNKVIASEHSEFSNGIGSICCVLDKLFSYNEVKEAMKTNTYLQSIFITYEDFLQLNPIPSSEEL